MAEWLITDLDYEMDDTSLIIPLCHKTSKLSKITRIVLKGCRTQLERTGLPLAKHGITWMQQEWWLQWIKNHKIYKNLWVHNDNLKNKNIDHQAVQMNGGQLLNGCGFTFTNDENVLELGRGDDCITLWKYQTPLNCIL